MSLSGKSSKRYFSVSQGYPNFSKSFNKKYNTKGYYVNYLEQKDNKYIGIYLNLVSNSSKKKGRIKIYIKKIKLIAIMIIIMRIYFRREKMKMIV